MKMNTVSLEKLNFNVKCGISTGWKGWLKDKHLFL